MQSLRSAFLPRLQATFAQLRTINRSQVRSTLQSATTEALALSKRTASRWGSAGFLLFGAYGIAWDDATRDAAWLQFHSFLQPLEQWRERQTQLRRLKQVFHHYGVSRSSGDVLELCPGPDGIFPAVGPELSDAQRSYAITYRALDLHQNHWGEGRLQSAAGVHAGVPESAMTFDSCSSRGRSMLQLLQEIPDASIQNVFAVNGLARVWNNTRVPAASILNHSPQTIAAANAAASAAAAAAASSTASPSASAESSVRSSPITELPTNENEELVLILTEVHRVLKPGGRFFFLETGAYDSGVYSFFQRIRTFIGIEMPAGRRTPLPIAQAIPHAGFDEAHVEQWPGYSIPGNSRRGVKLLQMKGNDDNSAVLLEGMSGVNPLVAGVATKSAKSAPVQIGGSLAPPALNNIFAR